MGTNRKPHNDLAGYVAELRNPYSGGHTIILDCKRAADQGQPLVADYVAEGGRYQVLCDKHGHLVYCDNLPAAREQMKNPDDFCIPCRVMAGELPVDDAGLADDEIERLRVALREKQEADSKPKRTRKKLQPLPKAKCAICGFQVTVSKQGVLVMHGNPKSRSFMCEGTGAKA